MLIVIIFQLFYISHKLNLILLALVTMNAPLWLLTATIKHTYFHWTIFNLNSAGIEIRFLVDLRSVIFFSTVLLISFSVFRFSYSYISTYKFFSRFTILLFIFVLSMIILIFASNIIFICSDEMAWVWAHIF